MFFNLKLENPYIELMWLHYGMIGAPVITGIKTYIDVFHPGYMKGCITSLNNHRFLWSWETGISLGTCLLRKLMIVGADF